MNEYVMFLQREYGPSLHHPQSLNGGFGHVPHLNPPTQANYRGPMNQIHSANARRNSRSRESTGQGRNTGFWRLNVQFQDETAIISQVNVNTRSSYVVDETILLNGIRSESRVTQNKNLLAGRIRRHLSTKNYQAPSDASGQDPGFCVVCQSDFSDGENLGKLECGHEYHAECIHKWLLEKNVCPVCKRTAISELER